MIFFEYNSELSNETDNIKLIDTLEIPIYDDILPMITIINEQV